MFNLEASGLIGILTSFFVEALKRAPQVALVKGHTNAIRGAAALFSFLGNLGYSLATGAMDTVNIVAQTAASFLVSFATYKGLISK